jgi:8-hydroxy-5-deazaflavin:NADPH oxidoreductase
MKLGIIGAGDVGGTLGAAWARKGHEVFFRRDQSTLGQDASAAALDRQHGAWRHRRRGGRVRRHHRAGNSLARDRGGDPLDRKPERAHRARLHQSARHGAGGLGLEIGHGISGGEKVQGWAAGASVFKTLNTTGFKNMAEPAFDRVKSVMFVAGDDEVAKPKVMALVGELGFEVVDAGPLRVAQLLEPHAMLWVHLALNRGFGRDWAFALMLR